MKKPKAKDTEVAVQMHATEEPAETRKRITGAAAESVAHRLVNQVASMSVWGGEKTDKEKGVAAVDLLEELRPANAAEAMLAVQAFSVHEASLLFLQRATMSGQTFAGSDANVLRAFRLMRLFNEQLDLMAKLKGKTSQQRVTVEHVHVHKGGQAIVGAVTAPRTGGEEGASREG